MHFHVVNGKWLTVAASISIFFAVAQATAAHATTSDVSAKVCNGGESTVLVTIDEPISDSTVSQSTVTLRGTTKDATQIAVYIDSSYVSVIPLGAKQTTYSYDLQLEAGTHTLSLEANGICGGSARASTVVTFRAEASNSIGENVPTEIGAPSSQDGLLIQPKQLDAGDRLEESKLFPGSNALRLFADKTGVAHTFSGSSVKGTARVAAVAVAAAVIVYAGSIASIAASNNARLKRYIKSNRRGYLAVSSTLLRLFAVALLILASMA